MDVIIAWCNRK